MAGFDPSTVGRFSDVDRGRTLDKVKWSNSILLKGDVAEEVAKLKAQEGGEIQVHGSGDLLQTLLKHDLIEHHLRTDLLTPRVPAAVLRLAQGAE